jgi:transcriptional regulator with XRE-family HTH domain
MIKSEFSRILRGYRTNQKKTQQEMANLLHVSQAAYARYEKGDRQPCIEQLITLAEFFQIPIDILVGRYKKAV